MSKSYIQSADEVLRTLGVGSQGLSSAQARERLAKYGPNRLKEGEKPSLIQRFLAQLKDPMLIILLIAAGVSALTGMLAGESEWAEVIIILAVVLLNAVLGVIQESKAEAAIEALQTMTAATCKVLRDGKLTVLHSDELVPGDVVILEAGDAVPADGRIIENASLKIEEAALTDTISKGTSQIAEQEAELDKLADTYGLTADAASSTADAVETLSEEYKAAEQAARQSIDSQIGYFDKLSTESDMTAEEIVANWQAQRDAINNYNDNLRKAVDMGLAPELVQQLADGSRESILYLNELVNSADTGVDEINAAFEEVAKSKDAVAKTMADVAQEMSDQLQQMASSAETNMSGITGVFEREVGQMQAAIDSLTGKTIYIDIVERTSSSGGKSNLPDLPSANAASVASYSADVPYLASGAVIPPNAPFYAVLGDQKSGNNLEAPESLIRKIVREESGGGCTEQLAQLLEVLIATVQNIEVGDTVIGEAANRYASRQKIIHGGGIG